MQHLATAAQMKETDRRAIHEWGIPSTLLMERAAQGIFDAVQELAEERPAGREKAVYLPEARGEVLMGGEVFPYTRNAPGQEKIVAVFAGPGNNGGDGVAVAGLLRRAGWTVRCFLVGKREKMTDDCREMERRLTELGGALEDYDSANGEQAAFALSAAVIVDAVFGVGLNSNLREPGASAVALMNRASAKVVAADIPSGVEADTGRVLGDAVRADVTVTFSMAKPGLYVGKGALCAGRVIVHDIGIPADILAGEDYLAHVIDGALVRSWLPRRLADSHKGNFGKVLVVGGSRGYTGAPIMAARGALRSGAGLVSLAVPEPVYQIAAIKCDEAMPSPLPVGEDGELDESALMPLLGMLAGKDAALLGPGLGRSAGAESLVYSVLTTVDFPLVVDADGINALSRHMDILDGRRDCPTIVTPHDGEFARMGGDLSDGDRLSAARRFAVEHGCLLVLKGHRTIIALPNGECFVNTTGNSGMAKGGSGDVLGGMILSLLGQGMNPVRAAVCAVWLHGRAGDLAAADKGEYGMLPTDLIEQIPYAMKELTV